MPYHSNTSEVCPLMNYFRHFNQQSIQDNVVSYFFHFNLSSVLEKQSRNLKQLNWLLSKASVVKQPLATSRLTWRCHVEEVERGI